MQKTFNMILMVITTLIATSCANIFGPNLTYLKKNYDVHFEETKNVSLYFDRSLAKDSSDIIPSDLKYIFIARVKVVLDPPLDASNPSFYAPLRKSTYSKVDFTEAYADLIDRLTYEAKSVGADSIIINLVGTDRIQRVDSVYMTAGRKVEYGPWFNLPMMKATFLKVDR